MHLSKTYSLPEEAIKEIAALVPVYGSLSKVIVAGLAALKGKKNGQDISVLPRIERGNDNRGAGSNNSKPSRKQENVDRARPLAPRQFKSPLLKPKDRKGSK